MCVFALVGVVGWSAVCRRLFLRSVSLSFFLLSTSVLRGVCVSQGTENVDSEWMVEDPLQDEEKEAMTQEIASLQSQQLQVASRYEKLRKSVSDMRNDSYKLKQKLKVSDGDV
jgi:uncharacterized protein YlxW (UPF0749 family)